jgi:hypothetical protein
MWDRCQRAWHFKYIEKLPEPEKESTAFGQELHSLAERYFRGWLTQRPNTEAGHLLGRGLPLWDDVFQPWVEAEVWYETPWADWSGRVDLAWTGPDGAPWVGDHKTTRSAKYIKTLDELRTDLQASVYSAWACQNSGEAQANMRWVYYVRDQRIEPVKREWRMNGRDRVLAVSERVGPAIAEAYEKKRAIDNPNYASCGMFGGCAFRNLCQGSIAMQKSALLQALERKQAAAAATPTPPAPAPSAPPPAVLEPEPTQYGVTEAAVEAPVATKRGRPPGARNKPKDAELIMVRDITPATYAAEAQPAPEPPEAPLPSTETCFDLYVDCWPVKGALEPVVLGSDLFAGAAEQAAVGCNQPHWALAEYGTGPALFATRARAVLAGFRGSLVLSSFTAEGKAVLELCSGMASRVVRS